jgi:hypothetical protein
MRDLCSQILISGRKVIEIQKETVINFEKIMSQKTMVQVNIQ